MVAVLVICGAWVAAGMVELFGVWVAQPMAESEPIRLFPYVLAITSTLATVIGSWRTVRPTWIAGVVVLSAAAGGTVLAVDWEPTSVRLFYRLQREDFAAVLALDAAMDVNTVIMPGAHINLGLPPHLEHLAIGGTVSRIGADSATLFVPVWARYPKRPGGYAYLGNATPAPAYACYDDECRTRLPVGDGWYWLERDTPEWAR